MNLVELTEFIVKELVSDPDSVSVKEFDSENEDEIVIQVMVQEKDMGVVIGRGGKIASAIRTIVMASSYLKDKKHVKINIDSY
ncbi:MAG TPA: KH domain-containing protein [Bacilli bacterium]|nr:KH domain-containing protein [Bacilli bacterium]